VNRKPAPQLSSEEMRDGLTCLQNQALKTFMAAA
jgi:hypothetical protein